MCLPSVLILNNSYEDFKQLETIFNSFKDTLTFNGEKVSVKHTPTYYINGQSIPESLWHMISKEENKGGPRYYLPARAKTITWFEPILKNAYEHCVKIRCWWAVDAISRKKGPVDRLHIYFTKGNNDEYNRYLIVLEKRKKHYQLVSAYPVTLKRKIESLEKSFKTAKYAYNTEKQCAC